MSKTPSAIPARLIGNGGKPIDRAKKQPAFSASISQDGYFVVTGKTAR